MRLLCLALLAALAGCARDNGLVTFNRGPSATITAPVEGALFVQESEVTLAGVVSDDTGVWNLAIEWASDLDGKLIEGDTPDRDGVVTFTTVNLSPGRHAITLTAVDPQAESAEDSVVLLVQPLARVPTVAVVHPATGETGEEGVGVDLVARVTDDDDAPDALLVTVTSDRDGEVCAAASDLLGVASCTAVLSPGEHALEFVVADPDGHTASALAYLEVIARVDIDDDGDGWTESQGDCDDADRFAHPTAPETPNGRDDDCDGTVDEGTVAYDDDGDGVTELDGDCDDGDPSVYPGADEDPDGIDDDCDGTVDQGTSDYDDDGDGYSEVDGDCDDGDDHVFPGATEVPDGVDEDCDGVVDEGTALYDDDGDGYAEVDGDCDDGDSSVQPGAIEACDGIDADCDGSVDEEDASGCDLYYFDGDGDGYGTTASRCLCDKSGSFDTTKTGDCYDLNADAFPGSGHEDTVARGDGSFDYDCDGRETVGSSALATCGHFPGCSGLAGWAGAGVPACGATDVWSLSCYKDGPSRCVFDTESRTQACR